MLTLDNDMIEWIEAHAADDTARLRLRHHGDARLSDAITQIECRRRTARKLHSTLECGAFLFPTALSAEQCTSDDVALFHASLLPAGGTVLDLTAGLGIDAFHAASVSSHVTAIELDHRVAVALPHNAEALGIGNLTAVNADCVAFLRSTSASFDTIFIDPARRGAGGKRLFALADCQPDVVSLIDDIRSRCNRLIIKASPMLDITRCLHDLPSVTHIYAIGTPTECKELVIVCDFNDNVPETMRHAVTVGNGVTYMFSFTAGQESAAECSYGMPEAGGFLYEPSPSAMKAGGVKILAERFCLRKLHPNTHLYFSVTPCDGFPGECRRIIDVVPFGKKGCKEITGKYPRASITTRNFVTDAPALARRLKTKDDDHIRIYGARCGSDDKAMLIVTAG